VVNFPYYNIAMKTSHLLAAVCGLLVVGAGPAFAATTDARAEVVYDHPEKFTDVKDSSMPTEQGSAAILKSLREYLVHQAGFLVPEGDKLTITFTDIDLAGDFEPWRGPQFDNIRIVKAIYPPQFKFSFTLTDASGRVIREGEENLLDQAFDMRMTLDRDDPLRFEKAILQDWMRRQMRGTRAGPTAQ
jgi:Protein of unknown function (DUF3016)